MSAPERIREERLSELFQAWRADIGSVPLPRLVSTETAVALVRCARALDSSRRAAEPPDGPAARRDGLVP
ncbi:hypothetical protein [Amycolatopsis methanolica]|uniref:Uncharacterized protein n=1 Tax=Amycolatopsis methanolica 239 TaxID=1068978 RepID=A0A076MZ78_AMYME|nr:hypothetical protein [Amycolatopsis methanolica]AIJ26519.1 hypothetical protein AMETH_6427 [Amycolatopsis methanolica 239]